MFKLIINRLATNECITLITKDFPTPDEIIYVAGVHPSSDGLSKLKKDGFFSGIYNHYTIEEYTVPSVKELQNLFVDYFKVAVYQGQRFGQYVYNTCKYEVNNSYNEIDPDVAYKILFESITQSLDEAVDGEVK